MCLLCVAHGHAAPHRGPSDLSFGVRILAAVLGSAAAASGVRRLLAGLGLNCRLSASGRSLADMRLRCLRTLGCRTTFVALGAAVLFAEVSGLRRTPALCSFALRMVWSLA